MEKYDVIRRHFGDRQYEVGDIREARREDVRHLVGKCIKKQVSPQNKSAKKLLNKSDQ